jgi:hypothetical protein
MFGSAFTLFILALVLVPVMLCVKPCVPSFRNPHHDEPRDGNLSVADDNLIDSRI